MMMRCFALIDGTRRDTNIIDDFNRLPPPDWDDGHMAVGKANDESG
jgi:hypothetical protein